MKKKVLIIISIIILIIIALWFTGVIPKQIGKIYGTKYMKDNFPKMQLEYANIEWNKYYGDYIITFKDKENKSYGCVISPKYFPVTLGQGLFEVQETYRENYEIENEPNKEPSEMRPPELYIHLENSQERIKAITGTFSWKENDLAVTADSAHPTVLEYQQENTIKYNGSKIIIENDNLKISAVNIYFLKSYDILAKEIHFDDNAIGINNLEAGEYALEIIADYPQGRVSYGIKISNDSIGENNTLTIREDVCELYLKVLEDLWNVDPGLNNEISQIGIDFSKLSHLTETEKETVMREFASKHNLPYIVGTWEELCEQGFIDKENLCWEDGLFLSIKTNEDAVWNLPAIKVGDSIPELTSFDAQKWRSGLGAYYFGQCTAQKNADGTWSYTVGQEAIS